MRERVLADINRIYSGDFKYAMSRYISKNYWYEVFKNELFFGHIDNLTDFSYSTCFSMFIHNTESFLPIGSELFKRHLESNGMVRIVSVQISVIAPYASIKYITYSLNEGEVRLQEQYEPKNDETKEIGSRILELLEKYKLEILPEDILNTVVPGISLELKEDEATVYNCLFEDNY